jgi:hypothetical protein
MSIWVQQPVARTVAVRVPTVIRYMPQVYVDEFFDHGKLMLSSFAKFREHPDESKRDVEEGQTHIEETNPNAKGVHLMGAPPCYVLCATSNQFDPEGVSWNTGSGFRILDPMSFAAAISWHIVAFSYGLQGACDYTDGPDVDVRSEKPFVPPDKHPGGPKGYQRDMERRIHDHTVDGLFSKARDFITESEYRFIWFANAAEPVHIVTCPEAREFCERIPSR